MNNAFGLMPGQRNSRPTKYWLFVVIVVAVVALVVLLVALAPILMFFLSILALLLGLLALAIGRIRWARIPNRRFAAGVAGGSIALLLASAVVGGQSMPTETPEKGAVAGIAAPATAEQATLASFLGQTCEADHLVMSRGSESNYCDKDTSGAFVWVDQANHDQSLAQAKEQAEEKAAQEKAAAEAKAEKAAQEKVAQEKAAAEAKAKKTAQEKVAQEKAAAEAKAKKAAERKAAAAEAEAERAAAAAEAEREAERQAEAESMVEDTAGTSAYYANCSAVKAAGAAPIYSRDPGYSSKLDRDGDGVGCES